MNPTFVACVPAEEWNQTGWNPFDEVMMMQIPASFGLRWASALPGLLLMPSLAGALAAPSIAIPHPATILLRAESVRRELGLNDGQTTAVVKIAAEAELPLWRLRDLPPAERDRAAGPVVDTLHTRLGTVLAARQRERLDQLVLQAQGIRAVLTPQTAEALKLTGGQVEKLRAILGPPARAASPAEAERNARSVLSRSQLLTLISLMGSPFDLSRVSQIACRAPEIEGVTTWINSSPLTLASVRGKVVVVHFYAFGCINCIRNLPHYNGWYRDFSPEDLAIIGIHRPETEVERDIEKVRQKIVEAEITYPVAVDNESRNWDAWVNRVWPSVYLIDKNGFIRYWWYGELNWQGARGEKWMRDRIAELLTEPPLQGD